MQARDAQAMMAHPSDGTFKHLVSSTNAMHNLDVSIPAIAIANSLFGPDLGGVRGKTVRRKPSAVRPEYVRIPRDLYECHKFVTLTADVMFVNGLPFLVTLSRGIKLGSIEFLPSCTAKNLIKALEKVILIYRREGFIVKTCLMDMEFEKLKSDMGPVEIITTAAREHVGDIEWYIRVIKERARSVASQLPYKIQMPDQMVIHLVKFVVMWVNALPHHNGISSVISPREMVLGLKMDFKKHCRVRSRAYMEASADEVITNTLRDRTERCIALGPTGNMQGSIACLNLDTNRVVSRRTVTALPMPDRVIKDVMRLGKSSKQKRKKELTLAFLDRRQRTFAWDDAAPDIDEGLVEEDTAHRDIPAEFAGIELESDHTDKAVEADPVTPEWQLAEQLFGEGGRKAATAKLTQMHDMATYKPMHAHELTREQRLQALSSLMFLTQKRDGQIKGRACANGSKQRGYIDKELATSPTVLTDSLMITATIDAVDLRDIVTLDIPGVFLHADLDEDVIMVLRGELAELMAKVKPKLYRPYIVTTLRGESILYVKMQKAMYGLLRSALLFYLKLRRDLEAFGFVVNDYDPCVANKIVNGTQITVMWHVDDLKVSHRDGKEITKLLVYLGRIYGPGITVNRGRRHDYLGIDFDFSEDGVARLTMTKHLEKIFEDFLEEIGKECTSPASEHLFKVWDPEETERLRKYLPEELAQHFHHTVAQLLYVGTRVRRDIQTAVAFLTTRVNIPDEDDWGKLKRVLKYLKGTKHMSLTLSVEDMSVIRWWVDASYNAHHDCGGQTGAMMSLGNGEVMSFSQKQKLNVRSLSEGELVRINDALPWILWCRYFIEAQGYTVEQNILYQDNKSTIQLEKNGRWSSSKRTKNIKSRYFLSRTRSTRAKSWWNISRRRRCGGTS
eukprot:CCRYP_010732-RA/>CCRYP_010732-RA protein AED:0.20 eAED:0.22 QI:0/0/0/1/1/1/2/0/901